MFHVTTFFKLQEHLVQTQFFYFQPLTWQESLVILDYCCSNFITLKTHHTLNLDKLSFIRKM